MSGLRLLNDSEASRNSWLAVSATECAPSASIAADPLISPAASLAIAIARFAASATSTVLRLSSPIGPSYPGSYTASHGRREAPARRAARLLRGRRPGRADRRARARALRRARLRAQGDRAQQARR